MTDGKSGGAADAETSGIGAASGRERRMTAGRKRDVVLRVLRGEPLEIVARELSVTAADVSGWRDAFLEAGGSVAEVGRDSPDGVRAVGGGDEQACPCDLPHDDLARHKRGPEAAWLAGDLV